MHSFLYELRDGNTVSNCEFNRLGHNHGLSFFNAINNLSKSINDYNNDSNEFRNYYRSCEQIKKRREFAVQSILENNKNAKGAQRQEIGDLNKKFPFDEEPSRLKSMALAAQMSEYTEQIENTALQGLAKVWVSQGLHQDQLQPQ